MWDPAEFQEIENLGTQEENLPEESFQEDFPEYDPREEKRQGRGSVLPLLQTALCVLALLALFVLKMADTETYGKVTEWYQSEAAREVELPKFWAKEETSSLSRAVSSEPPIAPDSDSGSLQRLSC